MKSVTEEDLILPNSTLYGKKQICLCFFLTLVWGDKISLARKLILIVYLCVSVNGKVVKPF